MSVRVTECLFSHSLAEVWTFQCAHFKSDLLVQSDWPCYVAFKALTLRLTVLQGFF